LDAPDQTFADLTVILPTLNEVGNLESLIDELMLRLPGCRVVVVDDNSSDGTPQLVEQICARNPAVRLIARHVHPCLTDSIQAGIEAAETHYVAWMDADHSHPPAVLRKLYERALSSGCCIATRYSRPEDSFTGRLPKGEVLAAGLSAILNFSVKHVLKLDVTDYTSGFIVCRRDLLRQHRLVGDYGEYFIELMCYLTRQGVRIAEVQYDSPPRKSGDSKTGASLALLARRGIKYLWLVGRLTLAARSSTSAN